MHEQILKIGIKMRRVFEEMKKANITDFDYFRDTLTEDWKEIDRRLKAFDWYNKHYHLPDELKHLEKGVSLKERKL